MFDATVERRLEFSDVLFDSWYFNKRLVSCIENNRYTWITKAKSNNILCLRGSWCPVDELVKLIPITKYRKIKYINPYGEEEFYYVYAFIGKVKHIGGPYRIVIVKSSWKTVDMDEISVIITSRMGINAEEVFRRYKGRWEIECVFRELKDGLYFDQYQVRSLTGITRHWHLCFLTYTFLVQYELTGSYKRIVQYKLQTIGKFISLYQNLQSHVSYIWILENREAYYKKLQLNSP